MKTLEIIFLIFTIVIPTIFLFALLKNFKRFKKSKKYRKDIIKIILLSFFINAFIFVGFKIYNTKQEKQDNIKVENKDESELEKNDNVDEEGNSSQDKMKTSKGYKIEVVDGITYIDGYLVVNKSYPLPASYIPTNTHSPVSGQICTDCLEKETYDAYTTMKKEANKNNLNIYISSGYRSYSYQNALYTGYVKRSGKESADTYSARAGHSEHQSGLAFDLNSVTDAFATTKEGIWINNNCQNYGFIIRYPKGKSEETGYKYEPWHLRYVGKELALKLYNDGDWITMEDYFGIDSKYED